MRYKGAFIAPDNVDEASKIWTIV